MKSADDIQAVHDLLAKLACNPTVMDQVVDPADQDRLDVTYSVFCWLLDERNEQDYSFASLIQSIALRLKATGHGSEVWTVNTCR